jgi:hypothetical protein
LHIGQDAHQIGEILRQVIGQNADAEVMDHALQHAEIVVHRQMAADVVAHQFPHQDRAGD